jgi:hypothetical protein
MKTSINLPRTALRALHSGWCEYLTTLPREVRDAMIRRAGGLEYRRFVLAVGRGEYLASARIDGDEAVIGLAVPVEGRRDWLLFEVPGRDAGVDAAWLIASETLELDATLDAILGRES